MEKKTTMGIVIPFRRRQAGHVDWEVGMFMAACLAVMVLFWTSVAIAFGAPSANWGVIAGWTSNDAATAGNAWDWSVLATPKTVNNGDAAPSFPASAMSIQIDA